MAMVSHIGVVDEELEINWRQWLLRALGDNRKGTHRHGGADYRGTLGDDRDRAREGGDK